MLSVYSLTAKDWSNYLVSQGESPASLTYWLKGLCGDAAIWEKHISPRFLKKVRQDFNFELPLISKIHESIDGTVKFQIRFKDLTEVETVLIPFHKRFTVCLSTQVGCGMNCSFCYTGTQGLKRNLHAEEIIGQYLVAKNWLLQKYPKSIKPSIVFMGQGEPLHNAQAVKKAVEVLNEPKLFGVGLRQMTLSTVGFVPGIREFATFPKINFALSLHSPFEEERTQLIPINARFPLKEVMQELDQIQLLRNQFITYEYLLIKNLNMTPAHAQELGALLGKRKAIINLIPFNPFPGSQWERPSNVEVEIFKELLVSQKLRVMVRNTKGDDILAACGQLKIKELARNYVT